MPEKLPRFVELIRVSSQGQADKDTPEDQRRALDRLRLSRPGTLVERIDSAVSGAKDVDDRADLQRLAELARRRAFDEVRVRHTDRLTRHDDPRERFAVYGIIADAGAVIVDGGGRVIDPKSEIGEMSWFFETLMASKERHRILERTQAGKVRAAASGRIAQGVAPYGRTFNKATGTWGVDEERARVYRKMFDLALAGSSLNQIAAKLNAQSSVCSPRGLPWTGSNIARLLRDEAAFGKYTAQGHTFEIPAIVSEQVFNSARAKMKSNNSLSGPKPTVFALCRKLLTCAVCGEVMYTVIGGGTPAYIRYYYCSSHNDDCLRYHRIEDVDNAVIERLSRWLKDPEVLNDAAKSRHAPEHASDEAKREIASVEKELRLLDRREVNTARMVSKGAIQQKTGMTLLDEIKALRADADARLVAARTRLDAANREAEVSTALADAVAQLRKSVARRTPEQWRKLVEILFPRGGLRIHPSGDLEFDGRIRVGARLEKPSRASGTTSA